MIPNPCLTQNGGCSASATCTNVNGTASCACNSGFTGNGLTCTPSQTTGPLEWVDVGVTTSYTAQAMGIGTDAANNVYAVGNYNHQIDFGTGSLTCNSYFCGYLVKLAADGTPAWTRSIGPLTPSTLGQATVRSMAMTHAGNVIVGGAFYGAVDFGGKIMSAPLPATYGINPPEDMFVAEYGTDGTLKWATQLGSTAEESLRGLGVDASDNVLFTGLVSSGSQLGTHTASAAQIAVGKLTAAGALSWAQFAGNSATFPDAARVDRNGNLWITGGYGYVASPAPPDLTGAATVSGNLLLAKFSSADGSLSWARTFPSGTGTSLAFDPSSGNAVLTGQLTQPIDFGKGTTSSAGAFLAAFDLSGNTLWSKTFASNYVQTTAYGYGSGSSVSIDANGNIALTGSVDFANFGGGLTFINGYFVATFNSAGTYRWQEFGKEATRGQQGSGGFGVAFDSLGHVVTTGNFPGTYDFGGIVKTSASISANTPFVAHYTP
jgi:hypothetical protein